MAPSKVTVEKSFKMRLFYNSTPKLLSLKISQNYRRNCLNYRKNSSD